MKTPGQVIKHLKAEFLNRLTPLPETKVTPEDTATFNFVVGCFNDAAADVLISAYEPEPAVNTNEDVKRERIEKAKRTREENKRKKAEKKAAREARKAEHKLPDEEFLDRIKEPVISLK